MTDRPILMSAPMVRALLREIEQPGTGKTQTRRLAWRPSKWEPGIECKHGYDACPICDADKPTIWQKVKPGDRLYVRETFGIGIDSDNEHDSNADRFLFHGVEGNETYDVPDDYEPPRNAKRHLHHKTPETPWIEIGPISKSHMPRWANRLTLVVTAAKMERVQEISEEDARAEGGEPHFSDKIGTVEHGFEWRQGYALSWNALNTKPGARWEDNPEVVALTFEVKRGNIDV